MENKNLKKEFFSVDNRFLRYVPTFHRFFISRQRVEGLGVFAIVALSYIFAVIACILIGWKLDCVLDGPVAITDFVIMLALFPAFIYLLVSRLRRRRGRRIIFTSLQIFAFFAILPYLLTFFAEVWGRSFLSNAYGPLIKMAIPLGAMLPELLAFIAFGLLKRYRMAGIIFIAVSVLIAIEIVPVRRAFTHEGSISDAEKFGAEEISREDEFRRSIQTIKELTAKSKLHSEENLKRVLIFNPFGLEERDESNNLPSYDWRREYKKEEYFVSMEIDSDEDGLPDFTEAEFLCDAYIPDTDGDGIKDGEDTDPLHPYIASALGLIKSDILCAMEDTSSFYLVDEAFYGKKGGFGNFGEHVILINFKDIEMWDMIFGFQHRVRFPEAYSIRKKREDEEYPGSYMSAFQYVGYKIDPFKRVAVVDFWVRFSGTSGHGYRLLLVNWHGRWHEVTWKLQCIAM
jgi:hypothetical protein